MLQPTPTGFTWLADPKKPKKTKDRLPLTAEDKLAADIMNRLRVERNKQDYPNLPYHTKPKPYDLRSTNDIENAICKFFNLHGYTTFEPTKTKGIMIKPEVVHYDFLGHAQIKEKAKYGKGKSINGSSDLKGACRNKAGQPMPLAIEVKSRYTKDRVSTDQIEYRRRYEAEGGTYIIVTCLYDLIVWAGDNVLNIPQYIDKSHR